jgi:hypothetical protein
LCVCISAYLSEAWGEWMEEKKFVQGCWAEITQTAYREKGLAD